jgi:hypothetical protein
MTRDEEAYPDAESFKPERFIKNGVLNKDIRDPRDIIFGFGRRCAFPRLPVLLFTFRLTLLSSDALGSVLVATWLSVPFGCVSLQSWPRLKLQSPMRLCCLKTGGTFLQAHSLCELFCIALMGVSLCETI